MFGFVTATRNRKDIMNRSTSLLAGLFLITCALVSTATAARSPLDTLSKETLNASAWAFAGLEETVPPEIRQSLSYLREDLLDEGKAAPQGSADSYKLGTELCNFLTAALDEREQARARAGFRTAQANAATKITSADLEVRRNYTMSWPQYVREQSQRSEISRQQNNQVALAKESIRLEWSNRVGTLRLNLDKLYKQFRETLRKNADVQNQGAAPKEPAVQKVEAPAENVIPQKPVAPVVAAQPDAQAVPADGVAALPPPPEIADLFTPEFKALAPNEQWNRVDAKLKELNPGYAGGIKYDKKGKGTVLNMLRAPVKNLWPLRALGNLDRFHCRGSDVTDLSPLSGMPLDEIECVNTPVSDLSSLRGMKLRSLNCNGTKVQDLSPLKGMSLVALQVNGTPVADLSPIAGMPIEHLGCARTPVTDLSVLKTLAKLRDLHLDFVPDRDTELLRSIKTLERINGFPIEQFWKNVEDGVFSKAHGKKKK